jgi:diketogulonate reductase-like aldo/keto reductase
VEQPTAWVRQRGPRIIPIVGVRKLDQLQDVLGGADVQISDEQLARLDSLSRIDLGFPYNLLQGPEGQMVYGDLEASIELPPTAPYRWR